MSLPAIGQMSKPTRIPQPVIRPGNWRDPQRYVIGWPDGVVKVGCTDHGRARWGGFLNRGGVMLDISYFTNHVHAEIWLREQLDAKYPRAFNSKEESSPYLGGKGGYSECYRVPLSDWPELLELARA